MKCGETHNMPVGQQCLQFAMTADTILGDSETSSISSLPLGQQCRDQASTEKIVSHDSPDTLDIILNIFRGLMMSLRK